MTDEEMAERYANENKITFEYPGMSDFVWQELKQAYLAGLKEDRPKWHKVADGDLPEAENHFWSRTVLLQTNKGSSIIGFYDQANKAWYEKATDDIVYGVIAWCEIPKYTEE